MNYLEHFESKLVKLKQNNQYRQFQLGLSDEKYIQIHAKKMLNLSSNDYLGLATNRYLREEFFDTLSIDQRQMSSSSSRLLTGNTLAYEQLEHTLSINFGRAALLLNSGYHMNSGILPALCDRKTIVLADKLVHASLIDGIRLAAVDYVRYRHNDLAHLEKLLIQYQEDKEIDRIIVVTESIFSMDGDEADLKQLVLLKKQFDKVILYVDEAHAIGVRGNLGLGCAEQYQVLNEIDLLVGTFGKALASVGGYVICHEIIRNYLINTMRPLIFSTAQPPICMQWTRFIFTKVLTLQKQREKLCSLSHKMHIGLKQKRLISPSTSHIVPIILGESNQAIDQAYHLQHNGYYVLPVRPPTVPKNTARLRICLNSQLSESEIDGILQFISDGKA